MRKGTESWCQYLHPSSLVTSSFTLIQSNSSSKRPDSLQIAAKTLTGPVYMSVVMFGCCPSSIPFFFRQIYNIAFGLLQALNYDLADKIIDYELVLILCILMHILADCLLAPNGLRSFLTKEGKRMMNPNQQPNASFRLLLSLTN